MRITLTGIALLLIGLAVPARAQPGPWAELARGDLEAIRHAILDHHPGPVDPRNPGYRAWLDEGYERALAMADSVTSLDGLFAVVSWYTSGFDDGHLGWVSSFERRWPAWPGFVVSLRGDRLVVDHVAEWAGETGLRPGLEVVACDGAPLERLLVEQVMAFEEGIPALEASRVRLAPRLFVYEPNPWRSRFETCRVRGSAGERSVELEWRSIDRGELAPLLARAAYGEAPTTYGVTRPDEGVAWVTVPSFAGNDEDNRAGLERLVDSLPGLRDEDLVVFDVRGNRGGNSAWGARLLGALFGEAYVDSVAAALYDDVYVEWRASEENADFIERSTLPRFEPGSDTRAYLERLVAAIRAGVASGDELVSVSDDEPGDAETSEIPPHPLGERVVLLTDGWCASACLDLADLLLAIPGVRHVGSPTYADAVYIDNRGVMLPSRLGWFGFSMKVYRNRPRGHNEPYLPDLEYPGERRETDALQAWVVETMR